MKAYLFLSTVLGVAFFGALAVASDLPKQWETSLIADFLNDQQQVIFGRTEAKQQIVEDVIAERLTLSQAADKFGELNTKAPECMSAVRMYFLSPTAKESLCREVDYKIKLALEQRTAEAERVIPRLKIETHEQFGETASGIE
jgi:hypothetical protein